MIRFIIKILYVLTCFFILLAGSVSFLVATNPGLKTLVQLAHIYIPGKWSVKQITGSLIKDFSLQGIEYHHQQLTLRIKQVQVQWHPNFSSFKKQHIVIEWHEVRGIYPERTLYSKIGTLTATTHFPQLNLRVHAKLDTSSTEHWQMSASLNGSYPWQWQVDANLTPTHNTPKNAIGLHANLSARGNIKAKDQGNLLVTIHPGYYQAPDNQAIPVIEFKGGAINFILTPEALTGIGSVPIDPEKSLKLNIKLPHYTLDKGFHAQQHIDGEVALEINSLDFLHHLSPELNTLKGIARASIKAQGTLAKTQIEGQLQLSKTSLVLAKIGLNLDAIDLNILGTKKNWHATGTIISGGHILELKGSGILEPAFNGDILLHGTDFPLIKTSEYQVHVSPQLKLHLTPTERALTGSIFIPEAIIKLQSFANSISLPDEVVYKSTDKTPSSPFNNSMDINIELGKKIILNVKGLKGHIEGTLNLKQQPQTPVIAYGELTIRDGTYKAYGQELAIQQGELVFTGGTITNPGINMRAAKKINTTPEAYTSATQLFDFNTNNLQSANLSDTMILGVEVTGRLTSPKIQLFSDPAILSQADILSMLVLGRPANQANKAGGQLLLAALSSMNVGGANTTQLLEQLKQSSGLDFNVQTNSNYNQTTNTVTDSTSFVVGKSLSKRLYLSYNIGLSQTDTNMLVLKYMLNKFFSIQVSNSDNSSAVDFLYTSNKKRIKPQNKRSDYRKKL